MMNKRSRKVLVYAAAISMALACAGCSEKNNDDGSRLSIIEGDDVKEYSSVSDGQRTDSTQPMIIENDDSVSGIARTLKIPDSADMDIPADGCGTVESASIKDDSIKVPDADKMYIKKFTMGKISAADRENILKSILNESDGIHEYPYDLKDDVTQEQRDALFTDKDTVPDYNKDYFIGKIDGREYILYFYDQDWSTDEGFTLFLAAGTEIPEDMQKKGASFVTSMVLSAEESGEINKKSDLGIAIDEENLCGMSSEQALTKAAEYMAKFGFKDVTSTSVGEVIKEYDSYQDEVGAVGYAKDGYSVSFEASVADQAIYQPDAFGVDTISHLSSENENFDIDNFYYLERSEYTINLDSEGLASFSCTWPMKSDADVVDSGDLISWDAAVDSLKKCMPEHFKDYVGYNKVEFNDVRLTYFRTKIGDGEYEAIPVYVFAQLDTERGSDETYPIQLVMIDARNGSEVSIMQDEARFGKN